MAAALANDPNPRDGGTNSLHVNQVSCGINWCSISSETISEELNNELDDDELDDELVLLQNIDNLRKLRDIFGKKVDTVHTAPNQKQGQVWKAAQITKEALLHPCV